jgi:hypothetical protein
MPAFLLSIPNSIPGAITRGDATVEPVLVDPTKPQGTRNHGC